MMITVHTLGIFDVRLNGVSLVQSTSGSIKIWELYKFMLTHRDFPFTSESLMDNLWEFEEYKDPKGTLRRQLYRLRQVLQENADDPLSCSIINTNGRYIWNKDKKAEIDAVRFENLVSEGDSLMESNATKAVDAYKRALDIYEGDYLSDGLSAHWVYSARSHYRNLYSKAVANASILMDSQGSHEELIDVCRKAVRIDPYDEEFHYSLIKALLMTGKKKLAIDHYEQTSEFFHRELGISLSGKMTEIYKEVLDESATLLSDSDLKTVLNADEVHKNAMYCELDVFMSIYKHESRKAERTGERFCVCAVTVPTSVDDSYSMIDKRLNRLKYHLMKHLRKSDILTRWNKRQMLLLLPGIEEPDMRMVMKRVLDMDAAYSEVKIDAIPLLEERRPYNRKNYGRY